MRDGAPLLSAQDEKGSGCDGQTVGDAELALVELCAQCSRHKRSLLGGRQHHGRQRLARRITRQSHLGYACARAQAACVINRRWMDDVFANEAMSLETAR